MWKRVGEDGVLYLASTKVNLHAGLYWYSKKCDPHCPNFMDRKNPTFRDLNGVQQVKFRELQHHGIGTVVRHTPVIAQEEEEKLWDSKRSLIFGAT